MTIILSKLFDERYLTPSEPSKLFVHAFLFAPLPLCWRMFTTSGQGKRQKLLHPVLLTGFEVEINDG